MTTKQIQRSLFWVTLFLMLGTWLKWQPSQAHEPITTKVTFNKEIASIFQRSCWGCHSAGQFKADIPLTTYEEARPWAKAIKEEVLEKRMPPYQAVKGYGSFAHDYILPQREIELIVSWVEGGAPKGEAKHYPKAQDGWVLGQPDLLLQPEHEVKLSGEGEEVARCLSLPTGLAQTRWVRGFDFRPGNGTLVYRASIEIEKSAAAPKGAACGEAAGEALGYWQPGQPAWQFPAGLARELPADARLRLKIYYRLNGDAATDRSQLALYFAKEATPKAVRSVVLTPAPAKLGVKDELQPVKASFTLTETAQAVAVRPLLFPFGQSVEVTAHRPDGSSEVLIWARNYRFDWQPSYVFKRPVALPRGTRIEATGYLENSNDNPNNPNETAKEITFNGPLCELLTVSSATTKPRRK
jgi:hypothetical protein